MSRKSQETIGPNVDIPATTESNAFQHEKLQQSFAASDGGLFLRSSIKSCSTIRKGSVPGSPGNIRKIRFISPDISGPRLCSVQSFASITRGNREGYNNGNARNQLF